MFASVIGRVQLMHLRLTIYSCGLISLMLSDVLARENFVGVRCEEIAFYVLGFVKLCKADPAVIVLFCKVG